MPSRPTPPSLQVHEVFCVCRRQLAAFIASAAADVRVSLSPDELSPDQWNPGRTVSRRNIQLERDGQFMSTR